MLKLTNINDNPVIFGKDFTKVKGMNIINKKYLQYKSGIITETICIVGAFRVCLLIEITLN